MSVPKALRYQVLRRDDHTCRYCGASAPDAKLTVDHVVPTALGGADEASNLVTACVDCNAGKAATPPDAALVDDVSASATRWAAAMRTASQTLQADRGRRDQIRQAFLDSWEGWTYAGKDGEHLTIELPNSWPNSIDSLAGAGLAVEDITDAVDIAMRADLVKDTFRYFCGVAWTTVRHLQDVTRDLLDDRPAGPPQHLLGADVAAAIRAAGVTGPGTDPNPSFRAERERMRQGRRPA